MVGAPEAHGPDLGTNEAWKRPGGDALDVSSNWRALQVTLECEALVSKGALKEAGAQRPTVVLLQQTERRKWVLHAWRVQISQRQAPGRGLDNHGRPMAPPRVFDNLPRTCPSSRWLPVPDRDDDVALVDDIVSRPFVALDRGYGRRHRPRSRVCEELLELLLRCGRREILHVVVRIAGKNRLDPDIFAKDCESLTHHKAIGPLRERGKDREPD